ncbi:hypothetical protein FHL15_010240 [Xylaria flabelliformis]|uniref:Uncharacterized protein n=1 Tax=Xylaria flabelliformis TaxID=2512241 RepID=A0A553HLV4_9PEZI|nr:hypothetical protein FHL15_010240 [Xylaria flabelliformis]
MLECGDALNATLLSTAAWRNVFRPANQPRRAFIIGGYNLANNSLPILSTMSNGIAERGDYIRPVKRQRTDDPTPEAGVHEQRRRDVAAVLGKRLEDLAFLHVERATAQLSSDIYDLGANVIRQIVDKDFEHHFNQGNERLSTLGELIIAAGVHRLVTELSSRVDVHISVTADT